jgi:hypothetical protein
MNSRAGVDTALRVNSRSYFDGERDCLVSLAVDAAIKCVTFGCEPAVRTPIGAVTH